MIHLLQQSLSFVGSFYVGSIMIIKLLILPEKWMELYHFCIGSIMIMVHPISSTNVLKEVKHQRIKGFCFKSLCCSNCFLFVVSICLLDPVYSLPSVLAFLYDATFGRLVFYNCGEQMTTIWNLANSANFLYFQVEEIYYCYYCYTHLLGHS